MAIILILDNVANHQICYPLVTCLLTKVLLKYNHLNNWYTTCRSVFQSVWSRRAIENIVAKGVIAQNEQFLHFPQWFKSYLLIMKTFIYGSFHILDVFKDACMVTDFQFRKFFAQIAKIGNLTFSHLQTHFYTYAADDFIKALWQKEKLLIMSNFSFATMFSTVLNNKTAIYRNFPKFCLICFMWATFRVKMGIEKLLFIIVSSMYNFEEPLHSILT